MLEWLRSAWTRWKVQVSFVGGALVVATAYGTCTFDAAETSADEVTEEPSAVETSETTQSTETATETTSEASGGTETTPETTENTTSAETEAPE